MYIERKYSSVNSDCVRVLGLQVILIFSSMLLHIFQFFYNYHFYSCSQKSFIEYKIISPRFESRNYIYPNGAHRPQKERVWRGEADVPLGPASAEPPAEWVFESDLGCSVNVQVNSWWTV